MSIKNFAQCLVLMFLCGSVSAEEIAEGYCAKLCEVKYTAAKNGHSAVYDYAACFIKCTVRNDAFDYIFRTRSAVSARSEAYVQTGRKILALLAQEDEPRAKVEYVKILFLVDRMRGKITRRQAAAVKLDEYICAHREEKKSRIPPLNRSCREDSDFRFYQQFSDIRHYILEQRPDLLTEEQKDIISTAYRTKQEQDYSQEIVAKLLAAAKQKRIDAQFLLHAALEIGIGVDVDLVESRAWLEVAVSQNPPFGKELIERASKLLSDEQTVEALGRADIYRKEYTNLYKQPAIVIIN